MNVLYIKCSEKKTQDSACLLVGEFFLEQYKENNPDDRIFVLDLYDVNLPKVDIEYIENFYNIDESQESEEETEEVFYNRNVFLSQFLLADKVIIASPTYNMMYPAKLKEYIDLLMVPNYSFILDEERIHYGILENKQVLYINSSAGIFEEDYELHFGVNHLKFIFSLMGISKFTTLNVTGVGQDKHDNKKLRKYFKKAQELASFY